MRPRMAALAAVGVALAVAALAPLRCHAAPAGAHGAGTQCESDMDCSLNGACVAGAGGRACVCDKGWQGPSCGELHVNETATVAYGIGGEEASTSSWGGGPPVWDDASSRYHLFVTEIAGNCGMCTWSRMSQIAHVTSDAAEGPYRRVETVVPTQAHNAYYAYSEPDGMHLLYHIFDGDSPESCNPYFRCRNGSTPGCRGLRPPSTPWPKPTCPTGAAQAHVHYSTSLGGPWRSAGALRINTTGMPHNVSGSSNPAPFIFPNGTVLMLGRGKDAGSGAASARANHNIFLYRAESWNATYEWVRGDGVDGAVNVGNGRLLTEDPTLWRGRRGFHMLLHSHPDLTHAWSADGLHWQWSSAVIGPPPASNGGSDNERPRVLLDADGDLDVLFVAQEAGPGDASRTAAFRAL